MSLLVEAGADVNAATALAGWTPLHLVAERGREMPDIMAAMIDRGADVNALNQREAKFNIALLRFLMVIYIFADPKEG